MEATINEHIPEWIPMCGKKTWVFYHGMRRQCINCFKKGHMKWECKEEKTNWKGYVTSLRSTGNYEDALFGNWLEEKPAETEKEKATPLKPTDLRELIKDPDELKKALAAYLSRRQTPKKATECRRDSRSLDRSRNRSRERSPEKQNGSDNRSSSNRRKPWNGPRRGNYWRDRKRYQSRYNHGEEKRGRKEN
jgi:hypothetical protein